MQLHCLGTAGYHPNEERHTSCYFLPESGIVLDAGTGLFRLPEWIQTPTLDILLSHAHLDHVAGLTFLLDVLHQRPVERLRIWGEAEKLAAIREHLFSRLLFPVPLQAEFCEIDERKSFAIQDCTVTWRRQQHPGTSVGYRLQWASGTRLLYLTDTVGDSDPATIEWYDSAELMLHECYFSDQQSQWALKTGHTWTGRLAEIAAAARPRRLLLTHVNPIDRNPTALVGEVSQAIAAIRARQPGETARDGKRSLADALEIGLAADHDVIEFGE